VLKYWLYFAVIHIMRGSWCRLYCEHLTSCSCLNTVSS